MAFTSGAFRFKTNNIKMESRSTSPDIGQSKQLSKILKIVQTKLIDNDINNLLIQVLIILKKLAIIIKILKSG